MSIVILQTTVFPENILGDPHEFTGKAPAYVHRLHARLAVRLERDERPDLPMLEEQLIEWQLGVELGPGRQTADIDHAALRLGRAPALRRAHVIQVEPLALALDTDSRFPGHVLLPENG
jgi:hypothetical protein